MTRRIKREYWKKIKGRGRNFEKNEGKGARPEDKKIDLQLW